MTRVEPSATGLCHSAKFGIIWYQVKTVTTRIPWPLLMQAANDSRLHSPLSLPWTATESVVCRTCISVAPLSHMTALTTEQKSRGGGSVECEMRKGAAFAQMRIFFDEIGASLRRANIEEDVKLKDQSHHSFWCQYQCYWYLFATNQPSRLIQLAPNLKAIPHTSIAASLKPAFWNSFFFAT